MSLDYYAATMAPMRPHNKSRNGCKTCRKRKVKVRILLASFRGGLAHDKQVVRRNITRLFKLCEKRNRVHLE